MIDRFAIQARYDLMSPHLDERGVRLFAASEAVAAGRGGIAAVSAVTGVARSTIGRGLNELAAQEEAPAQKRVRRVGGGRKASAVKQPGLIEALALPVNKHIANMVAWKTDPSTQDVSKCHGKGRQGVQGHRATPFVTKGTGQNN